MILYICLTAGTNPNLLKYTLVIEADLAGIYKYRLTPVIKPEFGSPTSISEDSCSERSSTTSMDT